MVRSELVCRPSTRLAWKCATAWQIVSFMQILLAQHREILRKATVCHTFHTPTKVKGQGHRANRSDLSIKLFDTPILILCKHNSKSKLR